MLAAMRGAADQVDPMRRARQLRLCGRATLILWAILWIAVGVVVMSGGSADMISGLAVIICVLFALTICFEALAWRIEKRELVAWLARTDLIATRSRGLRRVR
jgi:hypothetical protein